MPVADVPQLQLDTPTGIWPQKGADTLLADVEDYSSSDVIVLIMGLTGVGKSSFIQRLTGEDTGVGHSLCSATYSLRPYWYIGDGRRILLIDTPGLDDSNCSDTDIFQEIVFFLVQAYIAGARLGGVLYLHRITHNRVTGSGLHAFDLLKKMCGASAAKSVALVTTCWDQITAEEQYDKAVLREKELSEAEAFWGSMRRSGSRSMRWNGNHDSARTIIASLLEMADSSPPLSLQIQREIVDDGKELDDTEAGREMTRHHGTVWQRLRGELRSVTAQLEESRLRGNGELTRALNAHREEVQQNVERVEKAQRDLRDSFETLYTDKADMYRQLYLDAQREEAELRREIERLSAAEANERKGQQVMMVDPRKRPIRAKLQKPVPHQRHGKDGKANATPLSVMMERAKKRQVMKRNLIPILGILGGVAAMAAGGATLQIPIVAAGVALFGTAAMKVDFSRSLEKKNKKRDDEWEVQEHAD